jgi:hypothetical protein
VLLFRRGLVAEAAHLPADFPLESPEEESATRSSLFFRSPADRLAFHRHSGCAHEARKREREKERERERERESKRESKREETGWTGYVRVVVFADWVNFT